MRLNRAISVLPLVWLQMFAGQALAEMRTLLVPTTTIARGDIVDAESLREKPFIIGEAQAGNWLSRRTDADGREAKRTLMAGKPIPLAALKPSDAVKRGRPARAVYRTEGLEIATILTPLKDAPAGALVEARNAETGAIVEAIVQSNGELLVEAP